MLANISPMLAEAGKYKPVAGSVVVPATPEEKPVVDPEPETLPGEKPAAE